MSVMGEYREKSCPICHVKHRKRGLYCSRSCGNKKPHSEETKQKIANTQRAILTNGSDESEVRKYNYISKRNNADPEPVPPQVAPYIPDNSFLQDGDIWFEEK
jgi:hypothetical protein